MNNQDIIVEAVKEFLNKTAANDNDIVSSSMDVTIPLNERLQEVLTEKIFEVTGLKMSIEEFQEALTTLGYEPTGRFGNLWMRT